jgi:hypothetical protein
MRASPSDLSCAPSIKSASPSVTSTSSVHQEDSIALHVTDGMAAQGYQYRVGNRYRGQTVGVRLVGDTVQITQDHMLLRTHRVRHDRTHLCLTSRPGFGSWATVAPVPVSHRNPPFRPL